jgi:DNA topoisomerase-3
LNNSYKSGNYRKIISTGYLERKKKQLLPNNKGVSHVTKMLPEYLKSSELTADWENKMIII